MHQSDPGRADQFRTFHSFVKLYAEITPEPVLRCKVMRRNCHWAGQSRPTWRSGIILGIHSEYFRNWNEWNEFTANILEFEMNEMKLNEWNGENLPTNRETANEMMTSLLSPHPPLFAAPLPTFSSLRGGEENKTLNSKTEATLIPCGSWEGAGQF